MNKANRFLVISTGFALFSMFFGSGNLTFPLLVGYECGGHFLWAALGILLTGVLVPFIGAFALTLFDGDSRAFFGLLGKSAYFWVSLLFLGLMGPFGVLARCITVAHGSLCCLFPALGLPPFSFLFCGMIFLLAMRKGRIVPTLGSLLTPFLLLSLLVVTLFAFFNQPLPSPATTGQAIAFSTGLLKGYQLMDLVAAFFFSAFVMDFLRSAKGSMAKLFGFSALIGGALLAAVYVVLVAIGSLYAPALAGVAPQELLATVATVALGNWGGPVVAIAVILACLTTGVVLADLFASFLRTEVSRERIGPKLAMGVTLVIGFFISTLEFSGIAQFLEPILEVGYPALIVFTLTAIAYRLWGMRPHRWPALVAVALALVVYFL